MKKRNKLRLNPEELWQRLQDASRNLPAKLGQKRIVKWESSTKMLAQYQLMVAIDFNSMEVNGYQQLLGYQHSSEYCI